MEKIEPILKKHPLFKDLKPEYLNILASCASHRDFEAGTIIFKEGQEVESFDVIRSGLVSIEILNVNKPIVLETLQANDLLGWSWLFPPYCAHFNCRATEKTSVIALDGKLLRQKCEENHDFGYELMKRIISVVAHRLEATRGQLLNIYGG